MSTNIWSFCYSVNLDLFTIIHTELFNHYKKRPWGKKLQIIWLFRGFPVQEYGADQRKQTSLNVMFAKFYTPQRR